MRSLVGGVGGVPYIHRRCPASIFEGIALRRFARGVAIHRGERERGGGRGSNRPVSRLDLFHCRETETKGAVTA